MRNKRILLVTQYFYPENFKSNDLAFELVKRGYTVDALVGIPNYPEGVYYKGYNIFKRRIEKKDGVTIYRAFQTPRGRKSSRLLLILNYLTFAIFASLWAVFLVIFKKRYDRIIVHQTSPITQAYPAILIKKLCGTPILLWVLDIWPDAMVSGGRINNKLLLSLMNASVKSIYNHSSRILISSKGMVNSICTKGFFDDKIIYFPNWAERVFENPVYKEVKSLPDGFKIVMAGNLGSAQDLKSVMKAALLLKDTDVRWILIGEGRMKDWVENFVLENDLKHSVFLYGRFPVELMPSFYLQADALLLSLRGKFPHLSMIVPAKTQSYMSSGKPIIAMIDGCAQELLDFSKSGLFVNAGDYNGLANLIRDRILNNKVEFAAMGNNGRLFFNKHFRLDGCINNLVSIIENG